MTLILLSPVFLGVALLTKFSSPGPVFFVQDRLGMDGRVFRLIKFRTMTDRVRVRHQELLEASAEVTKVGYWLRRFKLDELPQLFNVLKGEMSIVGPRPALPEHLYILTREGRQRSTVRPRLTGLAQVNGNIHLSWEERWKYDAIYVKEVSFILDIRIILKTVLIVLFGEDRFIRRADEN